MYGLHFCDRLQQFHNGNLSNEQIYVMIKWMVWCEYFRLLDFLISQTLIRCKCEFIVLNQFSICFDDDVVQRSCFHFIFFMLFRNVFSSFFCLHHVSFLSKMDLYGHWTPSRFLVRQIYKVLPYYIHHKMHYSHFPFEFVLYWVIFVYINECWGCGCIYICVTQRSIKASVWINV